MDRRISGALVLAAIMGVAVPCSAQAPRKDVIWARSTAGAVITMDGILNEPAWALADSVVIRYGIDTGIPGSGWKPEAGILPSDPTFATLRFLTVGNTLWLGAVVRDKSIGGSKDFNRFDGLLMAIKNHASGGRPAPPAEYLYSWWYEADTPPNDTAPGKMPSFRGYWSNCSVSPPASCYTPRTAEQIAAWNAVTTVGGITNDDNNVDGNPSDDNDTGYVVEMMFDLGVMGYNVAQASGDIVEWNVSVYDCDWNWPNIPQFSANRVWWQNPWGNQAWYHNVRVHARPSVTIASGPAPVIGPEFRIRAADAFAAPTINGTLTEPVWAAATGIDLRYQDAALRASYPSVGPWRSGEHQPEVNGDREPDPLLDPADATVKWFFKGNILYLGFDVRDKLVTYVADASTQRWDGFLVSINDRVALGPDNNLAPRRLAFQVGPTGQALAHDYLPFLRDDLMGAQIALSLKPGTTVDTLGNNEDTGYTAELSIDLTKIGYPSGRGDGSIFMGINHIDNDCLTPFTDSYATRAWWFREYEGEDGSAWAVPRSRPAGGHRGRGEAGGARIARQRPEPVPRRHRDPSEPGGAARRRARRLRPAGEARGFEGVRTPGWGSPHAGLPSCVSDDRCLSLPRASQRPGDGRDRRTPR